MHRAEQRRQPGQRRRGERRAGRCGNARREGRRVEFVIGHQDERGADRLAGLRARNPSRGQNLRRWRRPPPGRRRALRPACAAALPPRQPAKPSPGLASGRSRARRVASIDKRGLDRRQIRPEGQHLRRLRKLRHVPQQSGGLLQRGVRRQSHGVAPAIEQPPAGNGGDRRRQHGLAPSDRALGDFGGAAAARPPREQAFGVGQRIEAAARIGGVGMRRDQPSRLT